MIDSQDISTRRTRLFELAKLFLRLGCTAFGGPAAHIAMMQDEVVTRRRWLSAEEFSDLLGATNLIPGPNSTEMAIHIGRRRAGWLGLVVAGACFIVPAVLIVSALACLYVRVGSVPRSLAMFAWTKPVVLAIVAQALWRLGSSVLKTRLLVGIAIASTTASYFGVHELVVLGASGALVAAIRGRARSTPSLFLPLGGAGATTAVTSVGSVGLWPLFFVFLIGSVLFGSGYVLLAFLRNDLVERLHWLDNAQLLDAVAVGQITPGPLFTTATFVGWLVRGPAGAAVATLGIFLPAFFFVAVSSPWVPRMRRSPFASAILDGVNAASLALLLVAAVALARGSITSVRGVSVALISLVLLLSTKINSVWLIVAAVVLGLLPG